LAVTRWLIAMILLVQRGGHDIENELAFKNHRGYVFHDSRGFEAGDAKELKIVQDFVRRRSQERTLAKRLHAIWFVTFGTVPVIATSQDFIFQVLHSDGQFSTITRFGEFWQDLPG
jgi:hypothetical protein